MTEKKTYVEKLRDPRWQKKRLEILERDKWTCQNCRATNKTLNVHHKIYYSTIKNPWDYSNNILVTLCEDALFVLVHVAKENLICEDIKAFAWLIASLSLQKSRLDIKRVIWTIGNIVIDDKLSRAALKMVEKRKDKELKG